MSRPAKPSCAGPNHALPLTAGPSPALSALNEDSREGCPSVLSSTALAAPDHAVPCQAEPRLALRRHALPCLDSVEPSGEGRSPQR